MIGAKGWCRRCRSMKIITDEHEEGYYAERSEHSVMVTDFECGHDSQTRPRIIGPAPGGESESEALAQQAMIRRQEAWGDE